MTVKKDFTAREGITGGFVEQTLCLAAALGVTKFIAITFVTLVTLLGLLSQTYIRNNICKTNRTSLQNISNVSLSILF
jgi:hypothetical protein